MSAILAILLMLSSAIAFVPFAHAQAPASLVTCNHDTKTPGGTGTSPDVTIDATTWSQATPFNVSIDVFNVTGLLTVQVGFYFNQSVLQVVNTFRGNVFNAVGASHKSYIPASWDNGLGTCDAELDSALGAAYAQDFPNAWATLMVVEFQINPAIAPYPPLHSINMADMIKFSVVNGDPRQIILVYKDGTSDITPYGHIEDGHFSLTVPAPQPHGPIASKVYSPHLIYVGDTVTFDASASQGGFDGTNYFPLVSWAWDFGDGNTGSGVIVTHAFGSAATFTVTLTVTDTAQETATEIEHIQVYVHSACEIDLYTQGWRYIDPFYIDVSQYTGAGPNQTATLFRPGDYVQLFAKISYGGAPVAGFLVSFQVNNTEGTLLVGTAISNAQGIAEYDFRVPWPDTPYIDYQNGTEFLPEFGQWKACATWQCGSIVGENGTMPWEKTQIDTMPFEVSWGAWVTGVYTCDVSGTAKGSFVRGPSTAAYVKITVQNDYPVVLTALATADLYDNLLVPIDGPAYAMYAFPASAATPIIVGPITVENWAFVGLAHVKANLFSTWPWLLGTSFCPEVVNTFSIGH